MAQRRAASTSGAGVNAGVQRLARELPDAEPGDDFMNINLLPFTILWMILSAVVVGLIVYRKWIAKDEDDRIHVMDCEAGMLSRQATVVHKLDTIDRWGKTLT